MNFKLKPSFAHSDMGQTALHPSHFSHQPSWTVSQEKLIDTHSWIDPETDFKGLNLQIGCSIVSVCGGGCHALAYLTKQPSVIHIIDTNMTQLAMFEIKAKAFQHLPDHNAVYQFLGPANHADNLKRYQRHIRIHLSEESSAIWQARNLLGQPRYHYFKKHLYRQGARDQLLQGFWKTAKLFGIDISQISNCSTLEEQRFRYTNTIEKALNKPWSKLFADLPACREILDRFNRYCSRYLLKDNYFTAYYLGQTSQNQAALPVYLQEANYAAIKKNISKIHQHHTHLQQFLKQQPEASIDAFQLLDIQDNMSDQEIIHLWDSIEKSADIGAKVIFRSKFKQPHFMSTLTTHLATHWVTNVAINQDLLNSEKSCFYNSIFLFEKQKTN